MSPSERNQADQASGDVRLFDAELGQAFDRVLADAGASPAPPLSTGGGRPGSLSRLVEEEIKAMAGDPADSAPLLSVPALAPAGSPASEPFSAVQPRPPPPRQRTWLGRAGRLLLSLALLLSLGIVVGGLWARFMG